MEIKVLGPGCAKCDRLFAEAEKAITATGKEVTLTKLTGLDEMMVYGMIVTPALVIDEQVVSSGKVLKEKAITELILKATKDQ